MITPDEMSEVGIGTEYLGNDGSRTNEAMSDENKLRQTFEGGINTLDTSPVSGKGRSELAIGDFLNHDNRREDVFLTSKCGYEWNIENGLTRDLTLERLQQELEESMNRMRVDVLDLYLLNTVRNDFSFKDSFNSLNHIKSHRNVRNIGLKDPSPDQLKSALEITNLDFVQLPHSLFNREPFETIEPICASNEIRIIVSDLLQGCGRNETAPPAEVTNGGIQTEEHFRDKLKFVLESTLGEKYSDEPMDALMASWALGCPGVHSGVLEVSEELELATILRVLEIFLAPEDYRAVDHILKSLDG